MIRTNRETWLVVGSSPSVTMYFDAALSVCDRSITANAGAYLFITAASLRGPDYYWLSDLVACELFGRAARYLRRTRMTRLVSMARSPEGLQLRGLEQVDILVHLPEREGEVPAFTRGQYVHPRLSGLVMLQFAANHGAERVICIGMDGYRSNESQIHVETFDGRTGKPSMEGHTADWIRPFSQSVIDACPNVEFVYAGKLRYRLHGENVTLLPTPEAFAEWSADLF